MIRATLFVSGRVQGVGFRYRTTEIAQSFVVSGTVENLDDGRVKIVVEGERDEIQRFVDEIQTSVSGRIKSIDRFDSEPSGDFDVFAIKR
ncbi:MAG: acylphosphatase [Planctomycetota bacterium]|nr:acylphosphatase [Planctomycetota bacterium]